MPLMKSEDVKSTTSDDDFEYVFCSSDEAKVMIQSTESMADESWVRIEPSVWDVLLTDLNDGILIDLGAREKNENLKPTKFHAPAFPVHGILFGPHSRFMAPLTCRRRTKKNSPTLNVWFIVDSGSPYTYISKTTFNALFTDVENSGTPSGFKVCIQAEELSVECYLSHHHFSDVNLLGVDAMRTLNISICGTNWATNSFWLANQISSSGGPSGQPVPTVQVRCPAVAAQKTIKSPEELEGLRDSGIRDSAAIVQWLYWFEKRLADREAKPLTEREAGAKMDELREEVARFVSLSFTTISAVGEHAALPHYHASNGSDEVEARSDQVFLLDSGGQYLDGTTDVTRTVWTNAKTAPDAFRRHFTLVLRGHVELARSIFPVDVSGMRLEAFSRHVLWQHRLDFGHGVGHGVGHFLNVHEGPIGLSYRTGDGGGVRAGMILTIEPGFYKVGSWGIRHENCYELVEAGPTPLQNDEDKEDWRPMLAFRSLTWVPFQRDLIIRELLGEENVQWLNDYHTEVRSKVGPVLRENGYDEEVKWLDAATEPL